ncbi:hypothetical protein ccbrp13_57270 [Ktedonobacteria bacterium brp13]|nr:hypothetical protein ccbrp13_57270 [Ktedonobacteria bacterium brp13]
MFKKRAVWIEAAYVFILSRIVVVFFSYVAASILPVDHSTEVFNCFSTPGKCFLMWDRYDVNSYIALAEHGYHSLRETAFFPLWPALLRIFAIPFGDNILAYTALGIVLANLFFYLALVLLYLLVLELYGDQQVAVRALYYIAFAPYAIFFFIGYTESLFLFCCLFTFFCLQRALQKGQMVYWLLAGIGGFCASLSRSQGIFLLVPYGLVFIQCYLWPLTHPLERSEWRTLFQFNIWRQRFVQTNWHEKFLALLPLLLVPMGLGLYMFYLWRTKGDPLAFSAAEVVWGRTGAMPWYTVHLALKNLFIDNTLQVQNLLNLLSVFVCLAVLIAGVRRLPLYYTLFAALLFVFPLLYPWGSVDPLASIPRYILVIFPVSIFLATVKSPRFEKAYLAFIVSFFIVFVMLFTLHYWVA